MRRYRCLLVAVPRVDASGSPSFLSRNHMSYDYSCTTFKKSFASLSCLRRSIQIVIHGSWECTSNISRVSSCDALHQYCPHVVHQVVPFQRNLHGHQQSFFLLSFHFGGGMKASDVPAVACNPMGWSCYALGRQAFHYPQIHPIFESALNSACHYCSLSSEFATFFAVFLSYVTVVCVIMFCIEQLLCNSEDVLLSSLIQFPLDRRCHRISHVYHLCERERRSLKWVLVLLVFCVFSLCLRLLHLNYDELIFSYCFHLCGVYGTHFPPYSFEDFYTQVAARLFYIYSTRPLHQATLNADFINIV